MADNELNVRIVATDAGLSTSLSDAADSTKAATDAMEAAFGSMSEAVGASASELLDSITTMAAGTAEAMGQVAGAEAQASARISAMVAASLEEVAALSGQTAAHEAYAASIDEMAAAATAAEKASAGLAASTAAVADAQEAAAAQFKVASTAVSDGATKVAEALNRQLVALTASAEQMAVYDAQMAGFTETEVAQIAAIAAEVEERKAQIAVAEEMAAAYTVDTVAAEGAAGATAGVTRELVVLGREAASGNFSRLAGSFTRLLSLSGMLSLLLNPVSIALIAVGGSMVEVSRQTDKLNSAIALTGGYAGVTADQLRAMASGATSNGASFNTAIDSITALAASAKFTGDEIARLGKTTADAATYTDLSVKNMVDMFSKLAEEPVKASVALNDQYHYLTLATYDQITALEKQGDATGAAQAAVDAFSAAMDQRTQEIAANEGIIERGWHSIKNAIEDAIQAVGHFGAAPSQGDIVSRLQANKAARQPIGQWSSADEAELQQALAKKTSMEQAATAKAAADRVQQEQISAKAAYDAWNNAYATPAEKRAKEIQKYLDTIAGPLNLSPEQQINDEQKINDKYKDHKAPHPHHANALPQAELGLAKAEQSATEAATAEHLATLKKMYDDQYANGLISIKQYYDAQLAVTQAGLRAQIQAKQAEVAAAQKNVSAASTNASSGAGNEAGVLRARAQLVTLTGQLNVLEDKLAQATVDNAAKREDAERKFNSALERDSISMRQSIADGEIASQKAIAESRYSMGLMTKDQLIQIEQQLEEQKYQIARDAIQKRLALEDTATYKNPAAIAQLNNQLLQLDAQYNASVIQNQAKMQEALAAPYTTMIDGVKNQFETGIADMLNGTKSFSQGLSAILTGVVQSFDRMVAQMLVRWIQSELTKTVATTSAVGTRTAVETGAVAATTAAHAVGAAAQVSTTVVAEGAKTGAVVAGNAVRTASDWAAALESTAATAWAAIKNIAVKAWEAAASVYAAIAAIPYVGPFLAPAMALAAVGTVIAFAGNIASAEGGYDIPSGVNPVTQLHEQEMVLPKAQADVIRRMSNMAMGEGMKAQGDTHVHIHAVDAASFEKRLTQAGGTLQNMIRQAHRDGKGGQLRSTWGAIG